MSPISHSGIVFCWGTLVMGSYVPTATTWMYGVYHLVTTQLPLTLLIAKIINIRTGSEALINANTTPATHYTRATIVTTNGLMFLIVLKQAWLGRAQLY